MWYCLSTGRLRGTAENIEAENLVRRVREDHAGVS